MQNFKKKTVANCATISIYQLPLQLNIFPACLVILQCGQLYFELFWNLVWNRVVNSLISRNFHQGEVGDKAGNKIINSWKLRTYNNKKVRDIDIPVGWLQHRVAIFLAALWRASPSVPIVAWFNIAPGNIRSKTGRRSTRQNARCTKWTCTLNGEGELNHPSWSLV